MPDDEPPVIEGTGLTRSFGRTRALSGVDVAVRPGECLGLVGRNGAGKSTLVSLLSGLRRPDAGVVRLGGKPAPPIGDRSAWQHRVACVYQHSMLVPTLTVAENVFLHRQPRRRSGTVDWRRMRAEAARVMADWGVDLDVTLPAGAITVEQRQIVEIARALSAGTRCLILDEPTAALEHAAIERLFGRLRPLLSAGVGILYISHHLEEVYQVCDRVSVLRDGRHVRTAATRDLDREDLVAAMVGETVGEDATRPGGDAPPPSAPTAAEGWPVLEVRGLSARTGRGALSGVDLTVRPGECVGLLGLRGSGSTVLADVVAGLVRPTGGTVRVDGRAVPAGRPDAALAAGVGYVPEDRHERGLVPMLSVAENITMTILDRLTRRGVLAPARRRRAAGALADRLEVVSAGTGQPVTELSGGNQQKVVVGRGLARRPAVLVAVGPTQGVDVASKASLLAALDTARAGGAGVLLVSDDLDDLRIATRIVVLVRGRVFTELTDPPWDRERLIAASEGIGGGTGGEE